MSQLSRMYLVLAVLATSDDQVIDGVPVDREHHALVRLPVQLLRLHPPMFLMSVVPLYIYPLTVLLQGYLAHQKLPPPRTLQYAYA